MKNQSTSIRELIQKLAGTYGKANVKIFDATVVSVDLNTCTCIVNSLDNSINGLQARYMLNISDGDISIPEEDSNVSVAMTDFTEPYIVKTTWLQDKLFVVGNQSFDIQTSKQIFNDGKYGGLAIVKNPDDSQAGLLQRYNLIEDKLNDILNQWNKFCQLYVPGSPTTSGLPVTLIQSVVQPILEKTTEIQISNPNITHGDKFGS